MRCAGTARSGICQVRRTTRILPPQKAIVGSPAPLGGEKLGLARILPADGGEPRLAHRAGDDRRELPRAAACRGPLQRGPGDQRPLAVGAARLGGEILQARPRSFAGPAGSVASQRAGPITATSSASCRVGREPSRDDLRTDPGRIAAGEGERALIQTLIPLRPAASAAARAKPRWPPPKNSRNTPRFGGAVNARSRAPRPRAPRMLPGVK